MENWELQQHEPNLPKPGEQKFFQAKAAKKIKEASKEEIAGAIKYAMIKIGLRSQNWPSPMERALLIFHIVEHFPENTIEEIRVAFDWAIDERLELGKDGFNCFENFSCAYFSRIFKAYNRIAVKVQVPVEAPKQIELKPEELEGYDEFMKTDFAKKLQKLGVEIPKY